MLAASAREDELLPEEKESREDWRVRNAEEAEAEGEEEGGARARGRGRATPLSAAEASHDVDEEESWEPRDRCRHRRSPPTAPLARSYRVNNVDILKVTFARNFLPGWGRVSQ